MLPLDPSPLTLDPQLMAVVKTFLQGFLSVITVTAAPQLYRYPYRISAEGLKGDMQRVGGDIESVIGRLMDAGEEREYD